MICGKYGGCAAARGGRGAVRSVADRAQGSYRAFSCRAWVFSRKKARNLILVEIFSSI
jgi:hypothetical protein